MIHVNYKLIYKIDSNLKIFDFYFILIIIKKVSNINVYLSKFLNLLNKFNKDFLIVVYNF